jgi:hypothetical protein
MSKQHSIAEVLLIAGRKAIIVDEVLRDADVSTQVVYGDTSHGFRPERHSVIVREGHYADEYEISVTDFRRLRATGVLAEAEQVPSQAASVARAHKAPAEGLFPWPDFPES